MGANPEPPQIPLLPMAPALTGAVGVEDYTGTASPQPAKTSM